MKIESPMKKLMMVMGIMILALVCMSTDSCNTVEYRNQKLNREIAEHSLDSVQVPKVEYHLERENVAAWFMNWDTPGKISYLYIFTQQGCIGYFVVSGKPISNRSYLLPEYTYFNNYTKQAPSLDGTFGEDLQGIRFRTANGTWHEFGGTNFSYIYADRPIPGLSPINLTP